MKEILELADERLVGADFANLTARASLVRVELEDGRLTGAVLPEAFLRDVTLRRCRLDFVSLMAARLQRVTFDECRLEQADLREARLKEVRFESCDLSGADFSNARLERCELRQCTLDGIRGAASLRGLAMTWEDIVGGAAVWAGALGIDLLDDG